jgi:hypothetical protein
MKHLNKILIAVMMMMSLPHAQDSDNPWAVSLELTQQTRVSSGNNGLEGFSQPFAVKDNWNIYLRYILHKSSRYIGNNSSFGVQGSVNK